MAYTELTPQDISRAGVTPAYASAAAAGNSWLNTGREMVHIKNGSGAPITVTFTPTVLTDGAATVAKTVSVTNAQERMIGPFPPALYNDSTGLMKLDFSGVTSLTLGVFRLT
jgi:hypothetical protein